MAYWRLTDCWQTTYWLLTDCWLIAWRFELERWKLRALDKLEPNGHTLWQCDSLWLGTQNISPLWKKSQLPVLGTFGDSIMCRYHKKVKLIIAKQGVSNQILFVLIHGSGMCDSCSNVRGAETRSRRSQSSPGAEWRVTLEARKRPRPRPQPSLSR